MLFTWSKIRSVVTTWGTVTLPTESDIIPKWSVEECNLKVLWVCVSRGPDHVVLSVWCFTLINELVARSRLLPEKRLVPQLVRTSPLLWNPKFHYPIHKRTGLVCILSQINRAFSPQTRSVNTRLNIVLLSSPLSSKWSPFFRIPHQTLYAPLPHSATCPAHLIILLIIRIAFCEEYKHLFPLNIRILQVQFTLLLIRAVISVSEAWYTVGRGRG
jgi:hypothetical protein